MAPHAASDTQLAVSAWLQAETQPLAWLDSAQCYRAASPAFQALVGRDPIGQPRPRVLAESLLPRLASPAPLAAYLARLEGGSEESLELPITLLLPRVAVLLYRSTPLRDADGQVIGWAEALLEQTTPAQLERRVLELEAALEHTREEMRRGLADKDQMIARVSHELRTPMTAIIGFCHMLLHYAGELTDQQRQYLQKVMKNASIQLQLLNNVLDISRLSSGQVSVMSEPVTLAPILAEAVEAVEPQTWDKAIELRSDLPDDLPALETDRLKLKQVLINLLSNAVKYTDEGSVRVAARPVDEQLELTVSDTGVGIPADSLERIFEPYTKLAESGPHGSVSSGLGLAICRRLTEMLGGTLTVESEVGVGSTFTLRLPVRRPDDPESA